MDKTVLYIKIIAVLVAILVALIFIIKKEYYNIPLIIVLALVFIFFLYKGIRNMNRYDWLATECAHEIFPIQIVGGDFIFKDGSSFYIPDGIISNRGWGEEGATHVAGADLKPLPVKLYIHWFSYAENKFFEGTFDLPYDKILKLFKGGIEDVGYGRQNYHYIIVGLAPEGEVSVFLSGIGATVEVINNLRATEVITDWKKVNDNEEISRTEYKNWVLSDYLSKEQFKQLGRNGISSGLMDSYRQQYPWKPQMSNCKPDYMLIKTFNGELEYYNYLKSQKKRNNRGIPKKIEAGWWDLKGTDYHAEIFFNEEKTIADFQNFFKNVTNEETAIEFVFMEKPRTLNRSKVLRTLDIYLKNSDSQVKLETDSIKVD
jgi:hypothetical protein